MTRSVAKEAICFGRKPLQHILFREVQSHRRITTSDSALDPSSLRLQRRNLCDPCRTDQLGRGRLPNPSSLGKDLASPQCRLKAAASGARAHGTRPWSPAENDAETPNHSHPDPVIWMSPDLTSLRPATRKHHHLFWCYISSPGSFVKRLDQEFGAFRASVGPLWAEKLRLDSKTLRRQSQERKQQGSPPEKGRATATGKKPAEEAQAEKAKDLMVLFASRAHSRETAVKRYRKSSPEGQAHLATVRASESCHVKMEAVCPL